MDTKYTFLWVSIRCEHKNIILQYVQLLSHDVISAFFVQTIALRICASIHLYYLIK
jgi:hypothetical protein